MNISTSISLYDGMSPALRNIMQASQSAASAMGKVKTAANSFGSSTAFEKANSSIKKCTSSQNKFKNSIQQTGPSISALGQKLQGIMRTVASIAAVKWVAGKVKDSLDAANEQIGAETKLTVVMRQRMRATDQQIESVRKLTEAQKNLGVVDDDVQIAGAQQLGTFLGSVDSLNTLIPAMNNLAVQQNGVNVTSEAMTGIANMMGKAMQGEVGSLARVGITFSAAEEKALKYGNEQQRAATLAQIITNNVGQMNKAMASTPAGKIQQVKMALDDVKKEVGFSLYPSVMKLLDCIKQNMPQIKQTIIGVANTLPGIIQGIIPIINCISRVTSFAQKNWSIVGPILGAAIGALAAWTIVTKIATAAQLGLNASVLPFILIVAAIAGVLAYAINYVGGLDNALTVLKMTVNLVGMSFQLVGMVIYNFACTAWEQIETFTDNVKLGFQAMGIGIKDAMVSAMSAAVKAVQDAVNAILTPINAVLDAIDKITGKNYHLKADFAGGVQDWANGILQSDSSYMNSQVSQADSLSKMRAAEQKIRNSNISKQVTAISVAGSKIGSAVSSMHTAAAKSQNSKWKMPEMKASNFLKGISTGLGPGASTGVLPGADAAKKAKKYLANADAAEKANKHLANIEKNTAKDDDIKYLRDFAERTAIQRQANQNININLGGITQSVSSRDDADGLVTYLVSALRKELASSGEGVHR